MQPYVSNQRRGGKAGALLRGVFVVLFWGAFLATPVVLVSTWADLCSEVPVAPDIVERRVHTAGTEILSSDGARIGGTRQGQRHWVTIDEIPTGVIAAFVAAEDEGFFEHHGVDPLSVLRAAWANARAGRIKQGGSTITQQLAKMYVGRERSYDRKVKEAMLARRIEQRFTKLEILEAYLNRIYLGAGAHGIAAAAERYFGRELDDLTLPQIALIAGLTAAPSNLNPYRNPEDALRRRSYVLGRMNELGLIDDEEMAQADEAPLELIGGRPDDTAAPYIVDETRRQLRSLDRELPEFRQRGERVLETTANVVLQQEAVAAVETGARRLGEHRQDRVVLLHLEPDEWSAFVADSEELLPAQLEPGGSYPALVTEVADSDAALLIGRKPVRLSPAGALWARYELVEEENGERTGPPRPLTAVMSVGDVVRVQLREEGAEPHNPPVTLLPIHQIQGALVALDNRTGGVRALAGGVGWDVTQYNRATRGCRQPGSAFKPILYSQALARGWTPASMMQDLPVRYEDSAGNLIWEPRNADRDFDGAMMMVSALAKSRNLPAVKLAHSMGIGRLAEHAQRLGISTELRATDSLALGASCVIPLELTSVYSVFARRGQASRPHLIRAVYGRDGSLHKDLGHYGEPAGPVDARIFRLMKAGRTVEQRVLTEEVGYLTTYLLQQVVAGGTAREAGDLPVAVAGKTGTTNRFDVWFVGFSFDLAVGVWLGDDRNKADLGDRESGGTSALPVWTEFMQVATAGTLDHDLLADPPDTVDFVRIDPESGLRAHPDGRGRWIPFASGSAPDSTAAGPVEREAAQADRLDREF